MNNLSWKERFTPRASGEDADHVPSGSPVILNLRTKPDVPEINSIAAIEALTRRNVPLLKAKHAIEATLADGACYLQVPRVESTEQLRSELQASGFAVRVMPLRGRAVDVKALREHLGISQEQLPHDIGSVSKCCRIGSSTGTSRIRLREMFWR